MLQTNKVERRRNQVIAPYALMIRAFGAHCQFQT
jgi:hypothetical protein